MTAKSPQQPPVDTPARVATGRDESAVADNPFRLLGISNRKVSPFGLLGVSPEINDRTAILHALRNQLARLEHHPEGRSPEADRLRRALQKAADLLLEPKTRAACRESFYGAAEPSVERTAVESSAKPQLAPPRSTTITPRPLLMPESSPSTAVPEHVAAGEPGPPAVDPVDAGITRAIASAGGWNACARRRVTAVAMENGLSPEVLARRIIQTIRVTGQQNIEARQRPARPHRPAQVPTLAPIPLERPTQESNDRVDNNKNSVASPAGPASELSPQLLTSATATPGSVPTQSLLPETLAEDVAHRTAVRNMTAAFIAFFLGLLIIIPFGIYIITEIVSSRAEIAADSPPLTTETDSTVNASAEAELIPNLPLPATRNTRPVQRLPITFTAALEELERDLHAADGLPASVQTKFKMLIAQTRHAWVRFDDRSLERLRAFIVSALYEKGTDTEAARALLEIIDPLVSPSSGNFDPGTVQPIIWSDALIAILTAESGLPATTRNELENHRRRRGMQRGNTNQNSALTITFQVAVQQAVEAIVPRLLEGRAETEAWQRWSEALQSINLPTEKIESIVCRTLYQLFNYEIELNLSEDARTNALILMTNVNWAQAAEARRSVLAWFSDPRVSAGDLAIITAYLVTSKEIPGLDASFILSVDATMAKRAQMNTQLAAAWKPAANATSRNIPSALDTDMVDWLARAERILNTPLPAETADAEAALILLLQTARLNAAAYLFESTSVVEAREVLASTDLKLLETQIKAELLTLSTAAVSRAAAAGNTIEDDGELALALAAAAEHNDRVGREEILQDLRHGLADDLGPADSAALVRLALTGSPRGIRELALDTIATRFAGGPHVLQRLVDSIAPDQPSRPISNLIEKITRRTLPDIKSHNWYAEARFALLEQILLLIGTTPEAARLDALAALLAQSYALRGGADSQSISKYLDPAVAADECFNTWMLRAQPMLPINPIPASRRAIERRRETRLYFQRDPIGVFAATQVGILEAALYVTAAERPAAVPDLLRILENANQQRAEASTGLAQLIRVERAILQVWIIRVRLAWGVNP